MTLPLLTRLKLMAIGASPLGTFHHEILRIAKEVEALEDDRVRLAMWTGSGLPEHWHRQEAEIGGDPYAGYAPNGYGEREYGPHVNPAVPAPTRKDRHGNLFKPYVYRLCGVVSPEGTWMLLHDTSGYGAAIIIAQGTCRVGEAFTACDAAAATYIASLATPPEKA